MSYDFEKLKLVQWEPSLLSANCRQITAIIWVWKIKTAENLISRVVRIALVKK